jgi:steroid delta-isomerase-like uncharacterized protein
MSTEANKRLVLDHLEAMVNRGDAETAKKQLAPDFVDHELPPNVPPGPAAAWRRREMLHEAFPDLHVEVEDIIAEHDRVAVRANWTGTHKGKVPFIDGPPTNRRFVIKGMVFWRISNGRIAERWAAVDRLGVREQLTAKLDGPGSSVPANPPAS